MESFRFASPIFLWLLVLVALAAIHRRRRRLSPSLGVPSLVSLRSLAPSPALRAAWLVDLLKYGALVLMILALARPQWGTRRESLRTEGVNIVLAVDLSESMAALDFRRGGKIVNRLEAVKGVVRDFIAKRRGDRIGMVVFGTNAYTQLPLTRDYAAIASILERLEIGAAGEATAVGDAIGISLKRLADIESRSNLIILLTDGQSNAGELAPTVVAEVAAQQGVKIYTIGVGTRGKAPFLIHDPVFGDRYVHQRVDIDEETLKAVAEQTGGMYFRAEDTEGLAEIYNTIDRMEKTEVEMEVYAEYREVYPHLLAPALLLLGLWVLLTNTRYLRVP